MPGHTLIKQGDEHQRKRGTRRKHLIEHEILKESDGVEKGHGKFSDI